MNLAELLDHLQNRVLRDKATPRLWTTEELTRYLNEAQDMFARRTHCLTDDTSDFTFIDTVIDEPLYTLDPRIVYVSDVLDPEGMPLLDRARRQIARPHGTGKPRIYTMDAAVRVMRLTPTPDAVYTLDLLVARKPLAPMVADTDEPEIDEDYHLALCDWGAYRALRNNDPDGSNTIAADGFRADWDMRVRDAKRNVFRMRSTPNQKARTNWTGKTRY